MLRGRIRMDFHLHQTTKNMEDNANVLMTGAARTFARGLYESVSRGPRSGRHYSHYPPGVNASIVGQYIQQVTDDFRSGIDVKQTNDPLTVQWGVFDRDQNKLDAITFGDPMQRLQARDPLGKAAKEFLPAANGAIAVLSGFLK